MEIFYLFILHLQCADTCSRSCTSAHALRRDSKVRDSDVLLPPAGSSPAVQLFIVNLETGEHLKESASYFSNNLPGRTQRQ